MRRAFPGGMCARAALATALACAPAAGCFSDRGLALEVDVGDTHASKVELYLGTTKCDPNSNDASIDCTTIAPPDGKLALRGDIWFRDSPKPYSAAVKGRKATFQLQADGDGDTTLPIVIAVGLGLTPLTDAPVATATLRDLVIPAHSARVATAVLTPAGAVQAKPPEIKDSAEDRVQVWTKSSPASSCVVVEHWNRGQVARDFVVPSEDPDCDDVPFPECNPAAYRGTSAIGGAASRPNCVTPAAERCVLGAFGCTDLPPVANGACVALSRPLCLPAELCQCSGLVDDCIQKTIDKDVGAAGSTISRIECEVPATAGSGICGGHDNDVIDLSGKLVSGCGREPLLASLQLAGAAQSHKFGTAEFEVSGASDRCAFKITWKSGTLSASTSLEHGFVLLEGTSGGVVLPIVFKFDLGACAVTPFHCTVVDNNADSVWGCAP